MNVDWDRDVNGAEPGGGPTQLVVIQLDKLAMTWTLNRIFAKECAQSKQRLVLATGLKINKLLGWRITW